MKTPLRCLLWIVLVCPWLQAADATPAVIAAVTAADDARVAAAIAMDRAKLEEVFSDDLHYAHSNGSIDTKASYIDSIVNRRSVYEDVKYASRQFKQVDPGVVLMTGRVLIRARNSAGAPLPLDLNFLAVWRLENGRWRFLAWQSSRNPPPPTP